MLPPIRVTPTEESQEFAKKLTAELQGILQFMLMGNPVELTPFEAFSMPIPTYLKAYKKKSILVTIDIEGKEDDKIYVFFEFNSAIVLGSYLRQHPELVIKTKLEAQEFPDIAEDAFGEIGNQFTGALDRSVRHLSNAELHLIMDFKKNIFPDEQISEEFFIPKKEYIVWLSTLTLEPWSKEKLTMLIPQPIFENIIGQRVTYVGLIPERVALFTWDKAFGKLVKDQVESRYCEIHLKDDLSDMVHSSKEMKYSIMVIDLESIAIPLPHDIDMFIKRFVKAGGQSSKRMWVSMQNANPETVANLTEAGLKGVTNADSKKELANWIKTQVKEIRAAKEEAKGK